LFVRIKYILSEVSLAPNWRILFPLGALQAQFDGALHHKFTIFLKLRSDEDQNLFWMRSLNVQF